MKKEKDDVITDAGIDDIVSRIQNIRSKCPQSVAYKAIKALEPFLEPCRIRLIDEYFSVVAEIEKDKKRLSRTERQDYLKRLLTPLIKLNRLHPSGENPYLKHDATYPFIEEKIWIDKEIDIESLHYDKQRYSIDFEYSKPLSYFDPDARNITIWDEYREYINKKKKKDAEAKVRGIKFRPITPINAGRTSLRELYKKWLPTLTPDKIKSTDMLDQMLVCFTIKRALNGDEKAIDKLYSIYENGAIGTAVNMANKRKLNKDDINDLKQEAKILLRFLISGFRPEDIINSLLDGKLKMPLQVENFYLWYYSDPVPKELDKIIKRPNKLDRIEIDYLLNPISIMDAYTFWQGTPKRVMKFNSNSFRPRKKTHLTTWLFGTGRVDMKSKLCQLISKSIDDYWKMKKEIPHELIEEKENLNYRPLRLKTGFVCKQCKQNVLAYEQPKKCVEHDENREIPIKRVRAGKKDKTPLDDETLEMAKNKLMESNIFKRNKKRCIEIVIQKLKGIGRNQHDFSYDSIAKKYNLTKRQVINICNKAKTP